MSKCSVTNSSIQNCKDKLDYFQGIVEKNQECTEKRAIWQNQKNQYLAQISYLTAQRDAAANSYELSKYAPDRHIFMNDTLVSCNDIYNRVNTGIGTCYWAQTYGYNGDKILAEAIQKCTACSYLGNRACGNNVLPQNIAAPESCGQWKYSGAPNNDIKPLLANLNSQLSTAQQNYALWMQTTPEPVCQEISGVNIMCQECVQCTDVSNLSAQNNIQVQLQQAQSCVANMQLKQNEEIPVTIPVTKPTPVPAPVPVPSLETDNTEKIIQSYKMFFFVLLVILITAVAILTWYYWEDFNLNE